MENDTHQDRTVFMLQRGSNMTRSTVGLLHDAEGGVMCYTLERGPGPNRRSFDRIPAGKYALDFRTVGGFHTRYAENFGVDFHKGMIELQDVPERDYILFHMGNYFTDTAGCILVGASYFVDDDNQLAISRSNETYRKVYPELVKAIAHGGADLRVVDSDDH